MLQWLIRDHRNAYSLAHLLAYPCVWKRVIFLLSFFLWKLQGFTFNTHLLVGPRRLGPLDDSRWVSGRRFQIFICYLFPSCVWSDLTQGSNLESTSHPSFVSKSNSPLRSWDQLANPRFVGTRNPLVAILTVTTRGRWSWWRTWWRGW
jgi:hypothetical protein